MEFRRVLFRSDQRISAVLDRRHDDIIGFGDGDLEFVDLGRHDIEPVGLHNGHSETRDADVEDRHRGRIDDTQPHALTRAEKRGRSEEHTSELQSLMRISYAVFCLKKKKNTYN